MITNYFRDNDISTSSILEVQSQLSISLQFHSREGKLSNWMAPATREERKNNQQTHAPRVYRIMRYFGRITRQK